MMRNPTRCAWGFDPKRFCQARVGGLFSFLQQPFFRRRYRLGVAEDNHDVAFLEPRFRCRLDGADAAAANGADFAAELLEIELIEGAPDGYGAVAEQHGVQARLVMIVDFVEVVVAGATVEAA